MKWKGVCSSVIALPGYIGDSDQVLKLRPVQYPDQSYNRGGVFGITGETTLSALFSPYLSMLTPPVHSDQLVTDNRRVLLTATIRSCALTPKSNHRVLCLL